MGARWRDLALLNYEVSPEILLPHLPAGTELDFFQGKTYFSIVAFLFEETTLFGFIPALFHRNFEEVNLRFYVIRKEKGEIKRGVVFVKEIVPKPFLAWTARTFYNENYVAMPMSHNIQRGGLYHYSWANNFLKLKTSNELLETQANSTERWITEHYWGYTRISNQKTYEYEVKHPLWNLYPVKDVEVEIDVPQLYGKEFGPAFAAGPSSSFLADGSKVTVHFPKLLNI